MTVDLETLRALLGQKTHAEIARLMGVSVITVRRKLKAAGLTRTYRSHSAAIPWTVPKGEDTHTFAQYLRELSAAADGSGPVVSDLPRISRPPGWSAKAKSCRARR